MIFTVSPQEKHEKRKNNLCNELTKFLHINFLQFKPKVSLLYHTDKLRCIVEFALFCCIKVSQELSVWLNFTLTERGVSLVHDHSGMYVAHDVK